MTVDEAVEYFKSRGLRSRTQDWTDGGVGLLASKQSTLESGDHVLQVIDLAAYIFPESGRWGVWWPAESRDRPPPEYNTLLEAVDAAAVRLFASDTHP